MKPISKKKQTELQKKFSEKEKKIWAYLQNWSHVLPTRLHLDTFIAHNEKLSEEDKQIFIDLWLKYWGKKDLIDEEHEVEENVKDPDAVPSFEYYEDEEKE